MPSFALVIGIDTYAWPRAALRGAARDAIDFAGWLVDSGMVEPSRLILAVASGAEAPEVPDKLAVSQANAKFADLLGHLTRLKRMVDESGGAEKVFFHFAGHGISSFARGEQTDALCAADFMPETPGLSLTTASIEELFRSFRAKEQYLLYDACRNAPLGTSIKPGEYDQETQPVLPYPPQYILKATAAGAAAADSDEGGAFTQTLLAGLRGEGAAKIWRSSEAAYPILWSRLCGFVAAKVKSRLPEDSPLRPPQEGGEHPAGSDPELARLRWDQVVPIALSLRFAGPDAPPSGKVDLRASDSFDSKEVDVASGTGACDVAPRTYVLRGRVPGYSVDPLTTALDLYEPGSVVMKLAPEPVAPSPTESASVDSTLLGAALSNMQGSLSRSVTQSFEVLKKFGPSIRFRVQPDDMVRSAPPTRLRVESRDPLTVIEIADANGGILEHASGKADIADTRAPYRITASGASGASEQQLIPDGTKPVSIEPPSAMTSALDRLARVEKLRIDRFGVLDSREQAPIASVDLATVLALGHAQAIGGGGDLARSLRLETPPHGSFHLIVIDEAGTPSLASLDGSGGVQPAIECSCAAPEARYLVADREPGGIRVLETTGAVLFSAVLPERATLSIIHRRPDASRAFYQMTIDPTQGGDACADAVRQAMFIQRRRQAQLLSVDDAATKALLDGKWRDPITSAVVAYTMLRLHGAEAEGPVATLATECEKAGLAEGPLLRAQLAALGGDPSQSAALAAAEQLDRMPLIADAVTAGARLVGSRKGSWAASILALRSRLYATELWARAAPTDDPYRKTRSSGDFRSPHR